MQIEFLKKNNFCRVSFLWHTAKNMFAVSPGSGHTVNNASLPCAPDLGTRQRFFAVCPDLGHTANLLFTVCLFFYHVFCTLAHGKCCVCRVSSICRVCVCRVPEMLHTANKRFPVVNWIRNVTFVNQVFIVGKQLTGPSFH